jgi:hypothetical protein
VDDRCKPAVDRVVDVFRRRYSGWTTVGYLALIVILPFAGSLIYWGGAQADGRGGRTGLLRAGGCAAQRRVTAI